MPVRHKPACVWWKMFLPSQQSPGQSRVRVLEVPVVTEEYCVSILFISLLYKHQQGRGAYWEKGKGHQAKKHSQGTPSRTVIRVYCVFIKLEYTEKDQNSSNGHLWKYSVSSFDFIHQINYENSYKFTARKLPFLAVLAEFDSIHFLVAHFVIWLGFTVTKQRYDT